MMRVSGLGYHKDREATLFQVNDAEKCLRAYRTYESKHRVNYVPVTAKRIVYMTEVFLAIRIKSSRCIAITSTQDWKRVMHPKRYLKSTVGTG